MMSQTEISIETSVYEKIKHIAEEKGITVSSYVNELLEKNASDTSHRDHVMKHFGSIKDESFRVPDDRPQSWNAPREKL
jgi:predicted DNA-binding ribbon-helix-helix protein